MSRKGSHYTARILRPNEIPKRQKPLSDTGRLTELVVGEEWYPGGSICLNVLAHRALLNALLKRRTPALAYIGL